MSPRLQRAALDQHGRDGSAALVELGFDHQAAGFAVGIGLEVEHFGLQQDGIQQLVEIGALERRHFDFERIAAHALDHDLVAQQIVADRVGIGRRACRSC